MPPASFIAGVSGETSVANSGVWKYSGGVWSQKLSTVDGIVDIDELIKIPTGEIFLVSDGAKGFGKSIDDGDTWTLNDFPPFGGNSGEEPNGVDEDGNMYLGDFFYAPTGQGAVQKSSDAGATWTKVYDVANPSDGGFITAPESTWASRGKVSWTEDIHLGGVHQTAKLVQNGVNLATFPTPAVRVRQIRGLYDSDMLWMWDIYDGWRSDQTRGLFKYDPVTASISFIEPPSDWIQTGGSQYFLYSIVMITEDLWFIAADTNFPDFTIYRTKDAGATWENVLNDPTRILPDAGVAEGARFISRDPLNHSRYIVAGLGGVFYSDQNGDAGSWTFFPSDDPTLEFNFVLYLGREIGYPGIAVYHADAPSTQVSFKRI